MHWSQKSWISYKDMACKERLKDWCKSVSAEGSSSQRSNFSFPRVVWVSRSPKHSFQPTFWNADGWYMQGKAKVIGKAVKNLQHHDTVLTTKHQRALQTETHRRPGEKRTTVSNVNRMPEILIQVLKPSWATGRFSTSGMWDCSRWEAREWIKSQTRRRLYFWKGEI